MTNAAFLYDAILLMAKSFDTILKEDPNNTLTDAARIYRIILNTTFDGKLLPYRLWIAKITSEMSATTSY